MLIRSDHFDIENLFYISEMLENVFFSPAIDLMEHTDDMFEFVIANVLDFVFQRRSVAFSHRLPIDGNT